MVMILTSNNLEDRNASSSLFNDNTNFQIVLASEEYENAISNNKELKYELYHKDGMEDKTLLDEYEEECENGIVRINELTYLGELVDIIFIKIQDAHYKLNPPKDKSSKTEDDIEDEDMNTPEDIMILSSLSTTAEKRLVSEINKKLRSRGINSTILSLYSMLKVTSIEKLTDILKNKLDTKFIYSDDPIQYAYAIYKSFIDK